MDAKWFDSKSPPAADGGRKARPVGKRGGVNSIGVSLPAFDSKLVTVNIVEKDAEVLIVVDGGEVLLQ